MSWAGCSLAKWRVLRRKIGSGRDRGLLRVGGGITDCVGGHVRGGWGVKGAFKERQGEAIGACQSHGSTSGLAYRRRGLGILEAGSVDRT